MYAILLKDNKVAGDYKFYTVKQEVMKDVEVTDELGNTSTVQEGTGEFRTVKFSTDDKEILEAECVKLMAIMPANDFIPITEHAYTTDLVWEVG